MILDQLFPLPADGRYRGSKSALWIMGGVIVMKAAISMGSIFNGRAASTGADGIPLESFGPGGAEAFVSILAALGLSNLMLDLIAGVVLIRYRALVPAMFVVLLSGTCCGAGSTSRSRCRARVRRRDSASTAHSSW